MAPKVEGGGTKRMTLNSQCINQIRISGIHNRPKRRDVAAGMFRFTDPSGQHLPEMLEKKRVQRWLGLHDYTWRNKTCQLRQRPRRRSGAYNRSRWHTKGVVGLV